MNADLGIWNKLTRVVVFLLFVALLLGVGVWYLPLIKENERMRKNILVYDNKIQKEEDIGKQLRNRIEALRRDPKTVERVIRETVGLAKPGETVVRFEAPVTNGLPR
jgi:hypothetical protein